MSGPRHPRYPRPHHPLQGSGQRLRRCVVEALVAGLAAGLITGVAVAFPSVLRQDPLTSLRDLAAFVVPGLAQASSATLPPCP